MTLKSWIIFKRIFTQVAKVMKYIRNIPKLCISTVLVWSLASYGFSPSTSHSTPLGFSSIEVPALAATTGAPLKSALATDSDVGDTESKSKKAENCNDVTPLEKPSGLPRFLRKITGDHKLRPKDKIPEFKLPQVDGEEVSLYDVLGENDYVVVDFWATACGPCIAQFPKLKELYSAYSDERFEIVSVCTDFTQEQWEGSLEEHKLPWIDVGEINDQGLVGPTSKAFRLRGLPRSYLVDTNGCILHTHIFPMKLENFLKSKYGEKLPSQEDSENPANLNTSVNDEEG